MNGVKTNGVKPFYSAWRKLIDTQGAYRRDLILLSGNYATTHEAMNAYRFTETWPKGYVLMGDDGVLYEWC